MKQMRSQMRTLVSDFILSFFISNYLFSSYYCDTVPIASSVSDSHFDSSQYSIMVLNKS